MKRLLHYTLLLYLFLSVSNFIQHAQAINIFRQQQQALELINSQQLEDELVAEVDLLTDPRDPDKARRHCNSCISLLKLMKRLCFLPERLQLAAMTNICKRSKYVNDQVCEGVVREQGPVLRKVLRSMDISGRDGHLLCASVFNVCPYPAIEPWTVPFPKPKPQRPYTPERTNETMTVLHLSDWHVDPQYEAGTEVLCDKPICCRSESTNFNKILNEASPWGSFGCDTPLALIESMLEYIPAVTPNTSFAILTGDIPPHEVWETLPTQKTQMIQDMSYKLLHAHFDTSFLINTTLYPAVGNHEAAPTNLFPLFESKIPSGERHDDLSMEWLYRSFEENWKGWVGEKHLVRVHDRSGSYTSHPVPGLKLISINTNFCYNLNWWLYEQPAKRDPNGILMWLVSHLQESEDAHEKVWIIGHSAPGDSTCFHDYSNYYYQIVERYAPHVIAGQFFGHTHRDEIQLFYSSESQKAEDAISVAYIGPSITPFPDLNPGFRTYDIDTGTFEVVDAHTYIANLNETTDWSRIPIWYKEYSAKELYGSGTNLNAPLSPAWWHYFTEEIEFDDSKFDHYWNNRYKSSPLTPDCDFICRINTVCGIRAGKSELRCDYIPSAPTNRPVILNRQDKDACGISLLKKT